MEDEEWRDIVGFNGSYSVSNTGRVRRNSGTTSNGRSWKGKILKPRFNRGGYVKYTLYRDGKPVYVVAHRLVCFAFHGPPPSGKPLALHRDDNPQNNHVTNLYWGSLSDNQRDVLANGNSFGRNKTHCINGHEYTEDNTYRSPKTNCRSCKTCRYNHTKASQLRRRNDDKRDD